MWISCPVPFLDSDVAAVLLDYKRDDYDKDGWKESLRSSDSEGTTHMRDLIAFMPGMEMLHESKK